MLVYALLLASAPTANGDLDKCLDSAATDPEFAECYRTAIDAAEVRLNMRWQKITVVLKTYQPSVRQKLVDEERNWIKYKDASCQFYFDNSADFGTLHQFIAAPSCRLQIINERIEDLDAILSYLDPEDAM